MIKKSSLLFFLLTFAVLLQNLFFHIVNPTSTTTLLLMIDILLMFTLSYYGSRNSECHYLHRYIWIVFTVVLIPQSIYGFQQGQSISDYVDVIRGAIYLLLSIPVFKIFLMDKKIDRVLNMITLLTVISLTILLLNSIALNEFGRSILPFDYFQAPPDGRNNRLRLLLISDFLSFVAIYSFSTFLEKKSMWKLIPFAICLGAEFYIEQTRMIEIAIIAACVIIYAKSISNSKYKYFSYFVSSCVLAYGFFDEWFNIFLDSFSIQNTTTGVSTLYRMIEWKTAWDLILQHPILGTGMVKDYRFSVYLDGVSVIYDHTDIGIIGTITYIGIIGTIALFIAPYIRCYKTFIQIPEENNHDRDVWFYTGLFVYLTVTSTTIIVTDNSRIFVWPFILAVEEYIRLKYVYERIGLYGEGR